jgi:hypothetical protein
MFRLSLFYAAFIMLWFFNCSEPRKNEHAKIITGTNVELQGEICAPYDVICINDEYMVIFNRSSCPYIFTLINIVERKVVKNFFTRGRGPEEFSMGIDLVQSLNNNSFDFFDLNLLTYHRVYLQELLSENEPIAHTIARFRTTGKWDDIQSYSKPSRAISINDSVFLVSDYFESGMIGLSTNRGKLINTFFEFPDNDENKTNNKLKHDVYQFQFARHPKENLFINLYYRCDYIKIYGMKNNNLYKQYENYSFLPNYENNVQQGSSLGYIFHKYDKYGNIDMTSNKSNIFILHSQKTYKDAFHGDYEDRSTGLIKVINWKGNLMGNYILDKEVSLIASPNNFPNVLYAFTEMPVPALYKYKIK